MSNKTIEVGGEYATKKDGQRAKVLAIITKPGGSSYAVGFVQSSAIGGNGVIAPMLWHHPSGEVSGPVPNGYNTAAIRLVTEGEELFNTLNSSQQKAVREIRTAVGLKNMRRLALKGITSFTDSQVAKLEEFLDA